VCDLTDAFDVTGPTISHHLRVLREAGLVDCQRRGTWVYYWIRPELLQALSGLLNRLPAAVWCPPRFPRPAGIQQLTFIYSPACPGPDALRTRSVVPAC
jgi:ArsR family transcriptional regulator